jgi:hypothetical protein
MFKPSFFALLFLVKGFAGSRNVVPDPNPRFFLSKKFGASSGCKKCI